MAIRTDVRAGVAAQFQAWWQNLLTDLPSLGDDILQTDEMWTFVMPEGLYRASTTCRRMDSR